MNGTAEAAHLLVVDDDARLRDLLQRFLTEQGFRVTAVADAVAARNAIGSMMFDLLVLDVMMPGESGLSVAEGLRREGNEVPILMLTARGAPEDRIAGFEHGVDDYLAKPFDPRELALRIRTILRRAAPPPGLPAGAAVLAGTFGVVARAAPPRRPPAGRCPPRAPAERTWIGSARMLGSGSYPGCATTSIGFLISRSMSFSSLCSSTQTSETADPSDPARPVRPMRCT